MTGEVTTYQSVSLADLGAEINDSHAQRYYRPVRR